MAPPRAPQAPPLRPAPAPASVEPAEPRRNLAELARDWDLLGPRGFAIVGGAVTALGVILLFVLAANRGWITPGMRVLIGALVSTLAVGAGFVIRHRYGQLQASLGAAGAGIAGGYASLAAATARYDLVPDWLALPLAGCLAAVAVAIAIGWGSEIVAGIGLLGSALAPGLQAIDTELAWPSAAFAVIVLVATIVVCVPRRWHRLLIAIAVVVAAQVAWLASLADHAAGAGTVAVVAALTLTVLAGGIWLQLTSGRDDLDPLATPFVLAATGLALVLTPLLYGSDHDLGLTLLGGAAVWAIAWGGLRVHQPALALVLGVSSLALAAVASANLLSGSGLAITWAAESILFSVLALRLRDARLQLTAIVYAILAAGDALLFDAPARLLFHAPVDGNAAIPVAAAALALLAAGVLAPVETEPRTETGLLAWLAQLRADLAAFRAGLQEAFVLAGAAAAWYAASIALVSEWFRSGHLAAVVLASLLGAVATALSARRGSAVAVAVSLAWLAGVLVLAVAFDVDEFQRHGGSFGGWALLAASAGALAGGYAFQILYPRPGKPWIPAVAGVTALVGSFAAIALLASYGDWDDQSAWIGVRELVPALVFAALSAGVFRIERHRSLATVMWSLAVAALVWSELLLLPNAAWRAVAVALTGAVLCLLAGPLSERRLWWAGTGLVSATSAVVLLFLVPVDHFVDAVANPGAGLAVALCCLGAGLVVRATAGVELHRWIDLVVAVGGLYLLSLGILEAAQQVFGGSVETDFERGHVAVSVVWALIGLALLVAGLLRDSSLLRYGGLALFGLSLAKIFLFDLSALSSVARALSFIAVGGLVLAGGFVLQKLSSRIDSRDRSRMPAVSGSVSGRIAFRQHVVRPLPALPVRDRRLAVGVRHEARALDELHPVDVPGAVREDVGRARPARRAGPRDTRRAAGRPRRSTRRRSRAAASAFAKSMNRMPDLRVDEQVPEREVHAVAVVARERERAARRRRARSPGSPPL